MGKTVGEIARGMSVHEFVDWQRFAAMHPFPADLADIHGAQALALLANINRDPKKTPPFEVRSFLVIRHAAPADDPPPPTSEAERMRDALMGMD